MHRSSDTIATIAAALAKAQVELINPEKSLVATIRSPFPREAHRTFRYAPLSSGLDIVRKSLGRHEIAMIQATSIDKEAGLLRLTTVLAHSSGEWISSDWPICQISDIASAQRMGAALTYARRYALFTLVGIAGEDDLDAPDLNVPPNPAADLHRNDATQSNGSARGHGKFRGPPARPLLEAQLSASLRESLSEQLAGINSPDEAATWAQRSLPAKNTLTAADAKIVEKQFQARLSTISDAHMAKGSCDDPAPSKSAEPQAPDLAVRSIPDQKAASTGSGKAAVTAKVPPGGKAIRDLGKTVRLRDKNHLKFVLRQPCLVCGRVPSDAHHLTFTQPRALGRRVSDEFTVPICRVHHRELHGARDEARWWQKINIDPLPVALTLWQQTRGVLRDASAKVADGVGHDPDLQG
jgi:hypothetical protein